jgi:hypothetical protein
MAPIVLDVSGKIESMDPAEPRPPALKQFILEFDKDVEIDTEGFPSCSAETLWRSDSKAAETACGHTIIGSVEASGSFVPSYRHVAPFLRWRIFNGGNRGSVDIFYIHSYLNNRSYSKERSSRASGAWGSK